MKENNKIGDDIQLYWFFEVERLLHTHIQLLHTHQNRRWHSISITQLATTLLNGGRIVEHNPKFWIEYSFSSEI